MKARRRSHRKSAAVVQRGQAFLLTVLLLAIGVGALVYNLASPARVEIDKEKTTAAALAKAKAALIGYAISMTDSNLNAGWRPGDLPCPDQNDDGSPDTPCNTQTTRIGRLPWKHLGLEDLRDGDGERLWYAVSVNFKKDDRTACNNPGETGCLNSDSRGTITIRNRSGTVINDGSNPDPYTPSGVIAVIFAPGAAIQRQDGTVQVRDCSGAGCLANGSCISTATAKCNVVNYLDVQTGVADNAAFADGSPTIGFIHGPITDTSGPTLDTGANVRGNVIVNDRLITITYEDLMPLLQQRVGREVLNCLNLYASTTQNSGRYPWAAPVGSYSSFSDQVDTRFGRVPDSPLTNTELGTVGGTADTTCPNWTVCMSRNWTSCGITLGTWWRNWKDMVFYGVADAYKPADPSWWSGTVPASGGCGTCLTVDPPSPTDNKRVVVIVAGKRLRAVAGGQPRDTTTYKRDATNYVEGQNDGGATQSIYTIQSISTTFNDLVLYQ